MTCICVGEAPNAGKGGIPPEDSVSIAEAGNGDRGGKTVANVLLKLSTGTGGRQDVMAICFHQPVFMLSVQLSIGMS